MICKAVQPLLSAYLDRELTGEEMYRVRDHLDRCSACNTELENLRSLKRLLGSLSDPEPPRGLESRLLANVLREKSRETGRKREFGSFLVFAGVAACSMFATLVVLNYSNRTPNVDSNNTAIAREIQRDQILSFDGSPLAGVPVVSAANYGVR